MFGMEGLQIFHFYLKVSKKEDPSTMICHIKNISMGLWLNKERKTHIQHPNMYKLYVSCNYIHKDFSVPASEHEHSVTAAPVTRALDLAAAQSQRQCTVPLLKKVICV